MDDNVLIKIAKTVDNNFIDNKHIRITRKVGYYNVIGHTVGGQCINADVKIFCDLGKKEISRVECDHWGSYKEVTDWTKDRIKNEVDTKDFIITF